MNGYMTGSFYDSIYGITKRNEFEALKLDAIRRAAKFCYASFIIDEIEVYGL